MPSTYLVTGGTGFLGQHLVRQLIDQGHQVRVLARSPDRALTRLGVVMVQGSILDAESVADACADVDGVYHLAGRVERDLTRAHVLYTLHVSGTRNVLEAAAKHGVKRVVIASTSGTVGVTRDGLTIPNDRSPHVTELVTGWPYYLSKVYAEKAAEALAQKLDVEIVQMRPTLLLGPGDARLSSTRDVLNYLDRKIPIVPSGGLSFVDVRDAAAAFRAAMDRGRPGAAYLLGAINLTFEAFFERLEAISDTRRPLLSVPDGLARLGARALDAGLKALGQTPDVDPVSVEMSQHFWYIDWSAAIEDLGFAPRDPSQTLYDTVQWIRANRATLAARAGASNPDAAAAEPGAAPRPVHDPHADHPFAPAQGWGDSGQQWRHTDWDKPTEDAWGKPITPDPQAPYAAHQGRSTLYTGELGDGPGLESLLTDAVGGTLKSIVGGFQRATRAAAAPKPNPYAAPAHAPSPAYASPDPTPRAASAASASSGHPDGTGGRTQLLRELDGLSEDQVATLLRLIRQMKR